MRETLNPSEGRKMNLIENIQNLKDVLNICKDCPEFSSVIRLKDEERMKGSTSLSGKLTELGNKYHDIFDLYGKRNPNNEEEFNEWRMNIQNFLVELGKIFDEMVVPGSKGKNPIVDGFVDEMFRLNDSFYELNSGINGQKSTALFGFCGLFDDDVDSYAKFSTAEIYEKIIKDFDSKKEGNKRLGIVVYYSLLKLINKELEMLLGKVPEKEGSFSKNELGDVVEGETKGEDIESIIVELKGLYREVSKKGGVLSKEDINGLSKRFSDSLVNKSEDDFKKVSKNLFIKDALGIKSYKDFCNKYDILKNKQKDLLVMEELMKQFFDEKGSLELGDKIKKLHMKKIERSLGVNFGDIVRQKWDRAKNGIENVLSREKMEQAKKKIASFKQKIVDVLYGNE